MKTSGRRSRDSFEWKTRILSAIMVGGRVVELIYRERDNFRE